MTERTEKPGRHVVESAITARDGNLVRKIALERKDLNRQQRDALLLVADLLDGSTRRPDQSSGPSTPVSSPLGGKGYGTDQLS